MKECLKNPDFRQQPLRAIVVEVAQIAAAASTGTVEGADAIETAAVTGQARGIEDAANTKDAEGIVNADGMHAIDEAQAGDTKGLAFVLSALVALHQLRMSQPGPDASIAEDDDAVLISWR